MHARPCTVHGGDHPRCLRLRPPPTPAPPRLRPCGPHPPRGHSHARPTPCAPSTHANVTNAEGHTHGSMRACSTRIMRSRWRSLRARAWLNLKFMFEGPRVRVSQGPCSGRPACATAAAAVATAAVVAAAASAACAWLLLLAPQYGQPGANLYKLVNSVHTLCFVVWRLPGHVEAQRIHAPQQPRAAAPAAPVRGGAPLAVQGHEQEHLGGLHLGAHR